MTNTVTEEEAKKKLCPFFQVAVAPCSPDYGDEIVERDSRGGNNEKWPGCLGSGCMAWQWDEGIAELERIRSKGGKKNKGYCGLARKS